MPIDPQVLNRALGGASNEKTPIAPAGTVTLYQPQDTVKKIRLQDSRKLNPATGAAFKQIGNKTINVNPTDISTIVAHAKAQGISPYDALAIAYQESGFGDKGMEYGQTKDYFANPDIEYGYTDLNEAKRNVQADMLARALKDKFSYASRLGMDKKGEDYILQAYNGYGKIFPEKGKDAGSYYGIPITRQAPLNMRDNPAYGKTVMSLRDEILKKNPEIVRLVESTPAFKLPGSQSVATK